MGDTLLSSGVVLLITLLGTIVATALLTSVTSRAVLGKPVTTSEAWRDARPQLPKLFGLTLPAAAHRRRDRRRRRPARVCSWPLGGSA